MENGYTIPVYINPIERQCGGNTAGGGGSQLPTSSQDGDKEQMAAAQAAKSQANAAKAMVITAAKKVATTALNNYGNITGDYVGQQNIQTLIGEASALGAAIALGPAGIAMYAVDKGLQAYNYVSQIKRSEAESAFKQKRVYAANRRS